MSKTIIFRLKRVRCTVVLFITSQCQPGTVPFFITRFAAESTLMSSFFYACFLRRSPHLLQIADVSLLYLHEVVTAQDTSARHSGGPSILYLPVFFSFLSVSCTPPAKYPAVVDNWRSAHTRHCHQSPTVPIQAENSSVPTSLYNTAWFLWEQFAEEWNFVTCKL